MQRGEADHADVPLIVDVAIGFVLCATIAFFVVVMEYCIGSGELSRAELQLLGPEPQSLHAYADQKIIGRE